MFKPLNFNSNFRSYRKLFLNAHGNEFTNEGKKQEDKRTRIHRQFNIII